jgi:ferredoxin-NADP reductase
MIRRYIPDAAPFHWWVCGPMSMIKAMRECITELGGDPKNMKLEGWG